MSVHKPILCGKQMSGKQFESMLEAQMDDTNIESSEVIEGAISIDNVTFEQAYDILLNLGVNDAALEMVTGINGDSLDTLDEVTQYLWSEPLADTLEEYMLEH